VIVPVDAWIFSPTTCLKSKASLPTRNKVKFVSVALWVQVMVVGCPMTRLEGTLRLIADTKGTRQRERALGEKVVSKQIEALLSSKRLTMQHAC